MAPEAERRLAAILSADVVGYSRLMAEDEDATVRRLAAYRTEVSNLVEEHRGRVVDFTGDNFLAEFPTATNAVESAVEIQRVIKARNAALPEGWAMEFRIGVHLGEVRAEGDRLYGDGVNIAARLESMAEAGGICISGTVHDQVHRKLEVGFEDLGERALKNIPRPVHVHRVRPTGIAETRHPWPRSMRRAIGAGLLVVGISALSLSWYFAGHGPGAGSPTGSSPTSVAVLPFVDMSRARDQEYFADGMAEEIINGLSKIEGLRVAARTSAFAFKGKNQDIREIGRQLDVGTVIEGSVRKEGNRLRITAQLIRVADGFHVWSQTYDRDLDDVFAIQSEIAQAVTGALRIKLRTNSGIRPPSTRSLAAYDDYLRGRQHLYAYTEGGTRKAMEFFERALEKDPEFALAHAGIADAYTLWYGFGLFSPEEGRIRSTAAARRALDLAPDLAEAHTSMGFVHLAHEWDFEAADRSWRRAMELAPSMVEPRLWHLVVYLGLTGRIEEALLEMPGVLALDPLSPMVQTNAAVLLYFMRRYDEAASKLEKLLEQQPDYQYARLMLARAYIQQKRYGEAARELEDWLARRGDPATYGGAFTVPPSGLLGYVDALTGRRSEALERMRDLALRSRAGSAWPLGVAVIQIGLGDLDQFFAWMDRAVEGRRIDHWVKVDPLYDPIRADPRYDDLLRRLGFPEG